MIQTQTNFIFDSHAHYDDPSFDVDRDILLPSLYERGVGRILNAASGMESSRTGVLLAERYPFISCSVGIHPQNAMEADDAAMDELRALAAHPEAVAIGEIGLDYHYDDPPRFIQQRAFERQLLLAVELDMPVIIHCREATEDTMRLLQKYRPRGVVHCFSGSAETAREVLALGMYLGFTGVVTFKNAKRAVQALEAVPLDRLLVETDCPYMAPVPYRGKRCDSSMLVETIGKMAQVKGISLSEMIGATRRNACELFGILQ